MESIREYAGRQIRIYRKLQGLTLQNLADRINKSRATVSKYESGDIVMDIETLSEVAKALNVELDQLVCNPENRIRLEPEENRQTLLIRNNPFFEAHRLYIYYYDGRYKKLKDGIIDVDKGEFNESGYKASLVLRIKTGNVVSNETWYRGRVVYSDMLIRFSFLNLYNTLEEDLLYIFNPLECRDYTEGLLCGISSADLLPCAFKCLVSLNPVEMDSRLKARLSMSTDELKRWQAMNMMVVSNGPGL